MGDRGIARLVTGILLFGSTSACDVTGSEETALHVHGTITDSITGEPLSSAVVQLLLWDLLSAEVIATAAADQDGNYTLLHIEDGFCPEGLFSLDASAPDRATQSFAEFRGDSIHVRCTEDAQRIDFRLQLK